MYITLLESLHRDICGDIERRKECIENSIELMKSALSCGENELLYEKLAVTTQHIELMTKELREALIVFYSDLRMIDIIPPNKPYPLSQEVDITLADGCVIIKMSAMMPYPIKGAVYYLHEQMSNALECFIKENRLPQPYYTERVAVVFLHHYAENKSSLRHLRDYDNVEHRCITNALAAQMMWGDSPKCMISMDALAPGKFNFTEVRVMPIPAFREFVMSEKLTFNLA